MKTVKHLPIIDAKRPVTLVITKRDVTTADTKEPAHCVVAKACRRMMNAAEVRVHLSRTYVRANEGNWTRFFTPRSLRQEIIAFDRGGKFEPGQYQLGVIPKAKQSKSAAGFADTTLSRMFAPVLRSGRSRSVSCRKRRPSGTEPTNGNGSL